MAIFERETQVRAKYRGGYFFFRQDNRIEKIGIIKKTDKKKENPIHLSEGVKYKSLWNKALKIESELRDYFLYSNIMFDYEDEETKRHIYKAMDELKAFRENLKLI